jgi:hypothetical protein
LSSNPIKTSHYSSAAGLAVAATAAVASKVGSITQSERSEPEPCLIVRPGIKHNKQTQQQSTTTAANKNDAIDQEVILREQQPSSAAATAGARPGNRNSRSWYAQYSQSFISQSLDQEPESKEDKDDTV